MTKKLEKLKSDYESICNEYVELFVKKQDIEFDGWVRDEVGGIAVFCEQYFFNLSDIILDLEKNERKGFILKWQNDSIEQPDGKYINYPSYSKGLRYSDLK